MNNLPPLTEKIEKGASGGHAFERLLHRLLLRDGQHHGYHYEPSSGPSGDWHGVDGLIRKGVFLGLGVPVGVQFKWLWGDPTLESSQRRQITESIEQAARLCPELKHWVLVTPHEMSNADRDWFEKLSLGRSFTLHHCGRIQIEEWLDGHPALLARYYPEAARNHPEAHGYDGTDIRGWAEQYRDKVAASHRNLRLLGLPARILEHQDKSGEIALEQVFIPQTLIPWGREGQVRQTLSQLVQEAGNGFSTDDGSIVRANTFQQPRPCVLLGDPGCGKSTILKFLSLLYGGQAQLGNTHVEPRVPLYLSLRDFVQRQDRQRPFSFVDALVDHAHSTYQMRSAHPFFFESLLLTGEAIVLMDGLDEVGDAARREQIARAVENFHREYPGCSLWVTSRLVGYAGNTRLSVEWFDHFTVDRLDLHQQHRFIRNWYAAQLPNDAHAREERVNSLISAVGRTPGVQRLASNPLLLTLITLIHDHAGRLPQNRCQLYDMCVDMLLDEWQQAKASGQPHPLHARGILSEDAKCWLAGLALWMQQRNETAKSEDARGLMPESELTEQLVDLRLAARRDNNVSAATDDTKAFLNYIRARTGLLVYRGDIAGQGQFAFAHLSFQEYLAAYQLSEDRSLSFNNHLEFFRRHLGHPVWEETLLLLLYRLSQSTGRRSFPDMFAKDFMRLRKRSRTKSASTHVRSLWITLGRALRDDVSFTPANARTIIQHLLSYWLIHSRSEAIYDPCWIGLYRVDERPLHPVFEGSLFLILEEIALFSKRWQPLLAELLEEAWLSLPSDVAVACMHLHARLLPLPKGAVEKLRQRPDLEMLAPDLTALWLRQDNACCLVGQPTMHHCFAALSSLDCGELHLRTLSWGKAPRAKAQCPERLHAALAFMVRKILAELASRAAFAAPRRTKEGAALFVRCGMIRVTHQLYRLEIPLAAVRTHELYIESSPVPSGLLWPLSVQERLGDYSRRVADDTCLTRWLEGFLKQHLGSFGSNAPFCLEPAASKLSWAFGGAFGRQLGWDFVRNVCSVFGQGFWTPPFISVFSREFGCNFSQSFVQDFGRKYVRIFLRMFVRIHYLITARFSFADFTSLFFRNILPAISCDFGGDFAHDLSRNLGNHGAALYRAVGVDPHHTDWQVRWDMAMDQARNAPSTRVASYWMPSISGLGEIEADITAEGSQLTASLGNPLSLPSMMADLWSAGVFNYLFALGRHLAAAGPSDEQIIMAALDWLPRNPFEVFNVGLAWEEHAIEYTAAVGRLSGPSGALFLAHAAYTALMTGLVGGQRSQPTWEQLVKERDQDDWLVRFSHLLYELCRFRDTACVELDMNTLLATCPRDFYAVLEAAGFLKNGCPIVRFG